MPETPREPRGKSKPSASRNTLVGIGPPLPIENVTSRRLLRPGRIIGNTYEIGELIGEGGMGQVYEARDLGLGRVVAIKIAWPDHGPDSLVREARVMAGFHDPSLVSVLALGEDDGIRYVVMERLYGRTLHQHILQRARVGGYTIPEIVHIMGGICGAMRALHEARLAHRDLKPANLILTADRIILLDFGILHAEQTVQQDDVVNGTPEYVAPEAIAGAIKVGQAYLTDLYALGVIGYQLATGTLPFLGESAVETVSAHIHDPIPDPTHKRPDLPQELALVIMDLLAKDPSDRPPSMEAVQRRLKVMGWQLESLRSDPISVLIADDDDDMLRRLHALVGRLIPHSSVHLATDGDEALRAFTQMPPDIMLLDLQLPGTNGVELAMYLRGTSLADRTSFVVVSGHAGGAERELLDHLGISEFITKGPSMDDELRQVVGRLLASVLHSRSARRRTRRSQFSRLEDG